MPRSGSCGRGAATGAAAPPRAAGHFNGMRAHYEASASYGQLARTRRANGTPHSLVNTNGEMGSCSLLKRRSARSSRTRDRGGPRSSRSSPATHAAVRGYKLANDGVDTRTIQAYLGHKSIQHTVRYTELAPTRFKSLFRD